ncbi:tyrosine-type recombinase/integrase [Salinicoccus carnicancri]|uniref:tyrosine-type recombinase/integrase n=1 Tax=Salinicoccus carnicancri TaxID=558170 RepID=UPI0002E65EE8|nr:site-specific integrase [Salinicoccus carnicancri]
MGKTKYACVYTDDKGKFYYQTELGIDRITGKRIRKKGRKDQYGVPFKTARDAYRELTRIKNEFHQVKSYSNYNMTYRQFMNDVYIPAYKTEVEESTFIVRKRAFHHLLERFGDIPLRSITIDQVQSFKTFLLSKDACGYSQSYAGLLFGTLRQSLEMAVNLNYLDYNISKKVKAIPKARTVTDYWTKTEFEKVINTIYIDDFYEHLNFVMLWIYFMTGVRVNEGTALWWDDVDFEKKRLRVHHMLIVKNKNNWKRNNYTKTTDGKRTIALDDDTIKILKQWKERQNEIGIDDFIFSYDGLPMLKSTVARIIARYSKLAGIHKIQSKGLRHSHASYLINEFNVSVLVLSNRLGHSSPEITLRHYAHMWSGLDDVIVEKMTGNIKIDTPTFSSVNFKGNQAIKK